MHATRDRGILPDLSLVFEGFLPWLALVAGAMFVSLAVIHVNDRAFITPAAGSRMGLAGYARDGTLYPPLFSHGFYGGTRMMPVPILLHAAFSLVTGEFLASGKILSYLSFAALALVGLAAMRSQGCSTIGSCVLVCLVAASHVGISASLLPSYDAMPVALQLGAVLLVARRRGRGSTVWAGVLCGLALLAKLDAIWGVVAIAAWLQRRDRASLKTFLGAWCAVVGVGVAVVELVSRGRFLSQIVGFIALSVGDDGPLRIVPQLLLAAISSPAFYILLGLGVAECVRARRAGEITIFHVAFVVAVPVLLGALTRSGATDNHFIDVLVLGAVLSARLWQRRPRSSSGVLIVPVLLTFGVAISLASLAGRTEAAIAGDDRLEADARLIDAYVGPGDRVLAEDPSIPVGLGEVPVVLDPFLLSDIAAEHPELIRPLVDRLDERTFDEVILIHSLAAAPQSWLVTPDGWYTRAFGVEVASAIDRDYVLLTNSPHYFVYVPRDRSPR